MKKIAFFAVLAMMGLAACSDDDSGTTSEQHSYSAHMKTECPSNSGTPIYDVCVSEAVFDYLFDLREGTAQPNDCLEVTFEDIEGNIVNDYLIRVEMDVIECN